MHRLVDKQVTVYAERAPTVLTLVALQHTSNTQILQITVTQNGRKYYISSVVNITSPSSLKIANQSFFSMQLSLESTFCDVD